MTASSERVASRFTMAVAVLRVGARFIASASLAGVQFRGNLAVDEREAVISLFLQLTQGNNPEATLAVDLAAASEEYGAIAAELQTAAASERRRVLEGAGAAAELAAAPLGKDGRGAVAE